MKIFSEYCIDTLSEIDYYLNEAIDFYDGNIPSNVN